mgnify:CR=1 FL=1
MKYTEFVKANYDKVANLPAKQRMAKLGQMWKASGHSSAKGKGVAGGDVAGGIFIKRKAGAKGKKKVAKARGKGIISDALGVFGLGMPEQGGDVAGGDVAGGDAHGSGILSSALGAFGLGMKKRGRKAKGGAYVGGGVAGGDVHGSGILSGILGSIGLGMPDKVKAKHLGRMMKLEKQLHDKGKLSPTAHHKLKVYHHLHGAGFFDSVWKGLKKGVGAVVDNLDTIKKVVPEVVKYAPQVMKMIKK